MIQKENNMKKKIFNWLSVSLLITSPVMAVASETGGEKHSDNMSQDSGIYSGIYSTNDSYNTAYEATSSSVSNGEYINNERETISSNEDVIFSNSNEKNSDSVLEEQKATDSSNTRDSLNIDSWMPDKNFQNEVSNRLNKPIEQITQEDMTNLKQIDFSSLEKDTVVDLTGLQYAVNLESLMTSKIIATNIPQLTMSSGATLYTRPNVLQHIVPTGAFSTIRIGNYDAYLSNEELIGIGQYLKGWSVTSLSIYTQNMSDFSVLNLPIEIQKDSTLLINTSESVKLKALEINENSTTNTLYQDTLAKDTNGTPMLSNVSNRMYSFNIVCFTKTGGLSFLEKNVDYQFTDKGIEFVKLPAESDHLLLHSIMPNSWVLGRSDNSTHIQYGVSYEIPINYIVIGGNVTVKYINEEGESIEPNMTLTGNIGETYSTKEVSIDGYTLKEVKGNTNGTFSATAQEVVYVYERSDAAPVTVKYQDSEGNQLAEPTVLNGKVGLPYTSEAKEIPSWNLAETPTNASGTYSDAAQEVVYVYERSDAAPVTVKYQDSEGNQLAEPTVLSGKVGLPYTSEAKEIPGWYIAETPTNASGTYSDAAQEVVYVYERSDAAPVTVKYQDSEGNQLAEPTVLSGKVGLPYTSEAKEIPGWYIAETPTNASGTYSDAAQEVVYVYERSDAAPVTVKYQDSEGNQLAEPTVLSGKVGLPYTSEAKEIPGWYIAETPTNASGTYSDAAQEVVYVYERSDAAPVTVKYQDSEGNQLAEPTVLSGKVGLPYTSEAKEIPGWYIAETPTNASGTYSDAAQEVVYVYERSDAAPVTVKYQDSEGNQLAEPTVLSGKVGLPYTSEAKEIPGWYIAETPTNASGTYSDAAQEVVYVYERSDAAPVTVKYQDSEGNQLAEPTVLSGKVGLPYTSEAKEIPGWYIAETPTNASGTYSDAAQEVVYVYERSDAAPVTVKYQDSEGNQLAEPTVLSGKVGLPYTSEAKEIPGWYIAETPTNASGTYSDAAQEVVYVYSFKSHNSNNHLPKAGEQIKGQIVLSSVGALLVTLVFVAFKKRKKSNR
jgi:uncharacterized surface anchored protein